MSTDVFLSDLTNAMPAEGAEKLLRCSVRMVVAPLNTTILGASPFSMIVHLRKQKSMFTV